MSEPDFESLPWTASMPNHVHNTAEYKLSSKTFLVIMQLYETLTLRSECFLSFL